MKKLLFTLFAAFAVTPAIAQQLGEHPAVIIAKQWKERGYDYQSKFYAHPAGLVLLSEAPHEMGEHPAVIIKRNWPNQGYDYAGKFYAHPAGMALYAAPAQDPPLTILCNELHNATTS